MSGHADRDRLVLAAIGAGKRNQQIAAELGLTRGVVAGIRFRARRYQAPGAAPAKEPPPLRARPLPQRERDGCRWPLWGDREAPTHEYCGGRIATPGRPYCAEHERRSRGKHTADQAAAEGLRHPAARRAGAALDGLVDGEAA